MIISRQSSCASLHFTVIAALWLMSCGQQTKKTDSFLPLPPRQVIIPTTPVAYRLADASCYNVSLSLNKPIEIRRSSIIISDKDTEERQIVQYQSLSTSSQYTGTDYLKGLEQGGRFLLSCDERDKNQNCRDNRFSFKPELKSSDFLICRDNFSYPEDSVEFVALSVIYSLEQAQNIFERANLGSQLSLQNFSVKMLVFPEYKVQMTYTNERGELISVQMPLTDNMAYSPNRDTGERKFIIYPDSYQVGLKLWRSPFVIHHEFGHYLEDFLGLNPCSETGGFLGWPKISKKKTIVSPALGKDSDDFWQNLVFIPEETQYVQSNYCGGVSEGFADLIAYLGLLGNSQSLKELGAESLITRNPASTIFADGTAKKMNYEVFNKLKQSDQPLDSTVEAHDLGAITAHIFIGSVQRLFSVVFRGQNLSPEEIYATAYKLAVTWHTKMVLSLKNNLQINDDIFFQLYKENILSAFDEFLATFIASEDSEKSRSLLTQNLCPYWDSVIEAPEVSCTF